MPGAAGGAYARSMQVIPVAGGVAIHSWAPGVERSALEQAVNLARLPFAIDHVALMPDAHTGYGMPIGGVLFADAAVVIEVDGETSVRGWQELRQTKGAGIRPGIAQRTAVFLARQ